MILFANLVASASFFQHFILFPIRGKAIFFFKIVLGRMLVSCKVKIFSANSFLKFSKATTCVFLKIS